MTDSEYLDRVLTANRARLEMSVRDGEAQLDADPESLLTLDEVIAE